MSEIVLWALPLVAIALGIAVEWLASKAVNAAAHRDFDGGFSYDNEPLRFTRIHSPHIVATKGDHHP